jgi:hypothetical protein
MSRFQQTGMKTGFRSGSGFEIAAREYPHSPGDTDNKLGFAPYFK